MSTVYRIWIQDKRMQKKDSAQNNKNTTKGRPQIGMALLKLKSNMEMKTLNWMAFSSGKYAWQSYHERPCKQTACVTLLIFHIQSVQLLCMHQNRMKLLEDLDTTFLLGQKTFHSLCRIVWNEIIKKKTQKQTTPNQINISPIFPQINTGHFQMKYLFFPTKMNYQ